MPPRIQGQFSANSGLLQRPSSRSSEPPARVQRGSSIGQVSGLCWADRGLKARIGSQGRRHLLGVDRTVEGGKDPTAPAMGVTGRGQASPGRPGHRTGAVPGGRGQYPRRRQGPGGDQKPAVLHGHRHELRRRYNRSPWIRFAWISATARSASAGPSKAVT